MKNYTLTIITGLLILPTMMLSQNIGISSTGATPDNSAMLDITSDSKGILIPRMSTAKRTSIPSPATGLMVYDTDLDCYYFYDGGWTSVCDVATLQTAYDGGGTGAGRLIDKAANKPVHFRSPSNATTIATSDVFAVSTNDATAWAINGYSQSSTAGAGYFAINSTTAEKPAVDIETNSDVNDAAKSPHGLVVTHTGSGTGVAILGQTATQLTTARFTNTNGSNNVEALQVVASGNGNSIRAIEGVHTGSGTSSNVGVYGESNSAGAGNGTGVYGVGGYIGVRGAGGTYAGYFSGNVHVTGTLSKAGGSFKIDHPQDPENKFLIHSFVESNEMMNVYNGNVFTDEDGFATITLPDYFETLNKDFRYQLTVVGTFAQAIIKEKIADNKFVIQTNQPNVEVSWQVTGVRQDPWAKANPIVDEQVKEGNEKGKYLNPELYGKAEEEDMFYEPMDKANVPVEVIKGKTP